MGASCSSTVTDDDDDTHNNGDSAQPDNDDDDDDAPPAFPLPNSIQRAASSGSGPLQLPLSTTKVPAKPRRKVALAPGHSTLDWARLKASGQDLRVRPPRPAHSLAH